TAPSHAAPTRRSSDLPLVSEKVPLDTGSARVPDSPAVAVIMPPTPAVSRSSSAYTPASGNDSSWRWASARPRVGRSPPSTSLPGPYALLRASPRVLALDRKSTRLNSSHQIISYAVFCLKKKKKPRAPTRTAERTLPLHPRQRTRTRTD